MRHLRMVVATKLAAVLLTSLVAVVVIFVLTVTRRKGRVPLPETQEDYLGENNPEVVAPAPRLASAGTAARYPGKATPTMRGNSGKRALASAKPTAITSPVLDVQRRAFASERMDSSWSTSAASQVKTALSAHLPEGTVIGSVECHTTLCSIETQHKGNEAYHMFVRATLTGELQGLWASNWSATITQEDADGVSAQVFIAREGYGLPQPPAGLSNE